MLIDEKYMKEAIKQAKKAEAIDEVPIGCVIISTDKLSTDKLSGDNLSVDKIIARGYNKRNSQKNTLAHAEIIAINKASKVIGDWRLEGCTMYITLEPCPMCAGAIIQARIDRVVIGSMNPKAGCAGSVMNLLQEEGFNHKADITYGVCEEECSELLTGFFRKLRLNKKKFEP